MRRLSFIVAASYAAILFLGAFGGLQSARAYNPPAGAEELPSAFSPSFMGGDSKITSFRAIHNYSVNPALSGYADRPILGAGYIALPGEWGVGHLGSLGLTVPTTIGNFSGLVHGGWTPDTDLNWGRFGRARLVFARDLLPNLLVGVATNYMAGDAPDGRFHVGFGGDFGMLHRLGDLGPLGDVRWGAVFRGLGFPYQPHRRDADGDQLSPLPAPFTPAAGISFNVYENESISLRLSNDISAPSFQNFRWEFGADLGINDYLHVTTGFTFDAWQIGRGDSDEQRSFIPSIGVNLNLTRMRDPDESADVFEDGLKFQASVTPLVGGVWATGVGVEYPFGSRDLSPPEIILGELEHSYISPNDSGVQDYLILPLDIRDEGFVRGYRVIIRNEDGEPVQEIINVDERPELAGVGDVFRELVAERRDIPVPDQIRWAGRTADGGPAPDGEYTYEVEAWDDQDNRTVSSRRSFVIDTESPDLNVGGPSGTDLIFNPAAPEGAKPVLPITQSGTAEVSIRAEFRDIDGNVVRSMNWDGREPDDFAWEGRNDAGNLAVDGVYSYSIVSTDRAGNRSQESISNIIVSTLDTSVFITASEYAFSPNGDGQLDMIELRPLLPIVEGLVEWEIYITDTRDEVLRTWSGAGESDPEDIVWDGSDTAGNVRDGSYRAHLWALYENGNEPEARTASFLLDASAPELTVDLDPTPFSPDGDGVEDEIFIKIDVDNLTSIEDWQLEIIDPRGDSFRVFSGTSEPPATLIWDGISDQGLLVQSAEDYPFELRVTDEVGNTAVVEGSIPVDILVVRDGDRLKIMIQNITFAPNVPQLATGDAPGASRNPVVLDRIAEILNRYENTDVLIEGHAVRIHWDDEERGRLEEEEELQPLSLARAETVRNELVARGVRAERLSVAGRGGTEPIVPHSDLDNRWQNRRVEFILLDRRR
ncbi:MAG: OmpA family protein [Spirochaeta sp.]|nr:OmpA family protein [Spirochaeta sp.]